MMGTTKVGRIGACLRARTLSRTLSLTVIAITGAGGCATITRAPTTVAVLQSDAARINSEQHAIRDSVVERLARRITVHGERDLDILILSGGGQQGSFGVGFLRGWASRTDTPLPAFDLVTGVSTGAVQAPFALMGTPDALDSLAHIYRNAAARLVPQPDRWFWLRRSGGLVRTERYERAIASVVSDALAAQLRAEFAKDRQLLLSTADFDLGVGHVWDLRAELARPTDGLDRARTLFYAATAIPAIFPPRMIDGHVHVDGGTISNILMPLTLDDLRALASRVRERGALREGDPPITIRVWVLLNLWTHAPVRVIRPSDRGRISRRSTELLFWGPQPSAVTRLQELAEAVTAGVPGVAMTVRVAAPDASLAQQPEADKLFDGPWMQRLETIGYDRARSANPWITITSAFERP